MLVPLIPPRLHGMLDYPMGLLLILSPWLFGFHHHHDAATVPIFLGCLLIVLSLLTDYPMGVYRKIPLLIHLWLDVGAGVILATSPVWLGFRHVVHWPHVALGLLEIGAALMTKNNLLELTPDREGRNVGNVGRPGMA